MHSSFFCWRFMHDIKIADDQNFVAVARFVSECVCALYLLYVFVFMWRFFVDVFCTESNQFYIHCFCVSCSADFCLQILSQICFCFVLFCFRIVCLLYIAHCPARV